ncbi:MAG TPA: lycopene cyclase domain-containing protein, partial [Cytophagaceae bacterium]
MMPYTYLLINFLTIIICFVFSFDKRIQFHRKFVPYLKAATLVAIPYIVWDVLFTVKGVWWFNTDYTIGIQYWGLPLEEWLFFLCIPFSCVFTYFCLNKFFNLDWANQYNRVIAMVTVIGCLTVAIVFQDRIYPFVTALVAAGTIGYLYFIARVKWIGKASLVFLILMAGFFPVNGVLTGTGLEAPIVNYNPDEILNIRMFTIPVEDAVYGYAQFM